MVEVHSKVGDLDARLDALALRVEASLARARTRVEQATPSFDHAEQAARDARLEAAEASALLQAQRCRALEDRIAELEAALVGAREQRAQAVAAAESAREQADRALDQLEAAPSNSNGMEAKLNEALQAKLLELEGMSSELVGLRRANEDWRGRVRTLRRDRDRATAEVERMAPQLSELSERDEASRKRLAELERLVVDQRRELELAERRAKHLREHMGARSH